MEDIVKKVKKTGRNLITYRITRSPARGIVLFVKSPAFEESFRRNGTIIGRAEWAGSRRVYVAPEGMLRENGSLKHWRYPQLISEMGEPNLGILRLEGLGEGIELEFHNVYSRKTILKFTRNFRRSVIDLYANYVKAAGMEVTINICEERSK